MPRPLFTANRQSANTLIWRRFDLFRRWRLLAWLIAAPLGYLYTAALLQQAAAGTAWLAWYPLLYSVAIALLFHRSLIRLLWNPPILVCDENGLTAFNEYGRWLGQWQWAQIAELRATREPGDYYTLEVIMHGDTPPRPQPGETSPAHDLARYGESYIPAPDNPPAAEAPRERLLLPELGPELPQALDEIRHHRTRATLDTPRAETRAWYKHPRSIQRDNWRLFGWLAAALVGAPLLAALFLRGGISTLPAALYGLGCAILLLRPGWQALRRLIADPARPVARIDGEGIRIDDGATRLRLSWRDLRRIENDDGVLVLSDYRDRHYRTLRAAGNDDRSIDAIVVASRAMRDGDPLPDDTPLPPPRRRPLAWLLLANSLLLLASLTLLYLSRAPRETGLTLLALLAIAALAWWARQSHWQTQATYREPLPATPPAPRPDLPVRQWYRHPRAIARANWLAWWLLLPASLLAMRAPRPRRRPPPLAHLRLRDPPHCPQRPRRPAPRTHQPAPARLPPHPPLRHPRRQQTELHHPLGRTGRHQHRLAPEPQSAHPQRPERRPARHPLPCRRRRNHRARHRPRCPRLQNPPGRPRRPHRLQRPRIPPLHGTHPARRTTRRPRPRQRTRPRAAPNPPGDPATAGHRRRHPCRHRPPPRRAKREQHPACPQPPAAHPLASLGAAHRQPCLHHPLDPHLPHRPRRKQPQPHHLGTTHPPPAQHRRPPRRLPPTSNPATRTAPRAATTAPGHQHARLVQTGTPHRPCQRPRLRQTVPAGDAWRSPR